jgi:Holliday junction DNA helicase RuvA
MAKILTIARNLVAAAEGNRQTAWAMIVFLEGILQEQSPLHCVVNVQGVGYGVHIPLTVHEKLPSIGEHIRFYIHPIYRADTQDLFGFLGPEDRQLFQLLIAKVPGVGAKLALSILSRLDRATLEQAITQRNAQLLSRIPGIGKKTAERIIIELSDAIQKLRPAMAEPILSVSSSTVQDAVVALMTLGYKAQDAEKTILKASQLIGEQASSETLLRHALRHAP